MAINFKNLLAPVEIFFTRKYKNYHARGKVFLNFTRVFETLQNADKYQGVYTLGLYALVNNEYLKKAAKSDPEDKSFLFALIGANKREYDKTMASILRGLITNKIKALSPDLTNSSSFRPEKLSARQLLKNANKPITLTSLKIEDKEYIESKISDMPPAIPAGIFLEPEYIIDRATQKPAKPFNHHPYHVFSCNYAQALKHYSDGRYSLFAEWLSYFYDQLSSVFGYPKLSKIEFIEASKHIANLGYEWMTTKTASRPFLNKVNAYLDAPITEDCYLSDFCDSVFFSLVDDMLEARAVSECQHCGLLFPFEKGKKYCSPKTDGRNCGKTARNKKYYYKNRLKLLPSIREDVAAARKLYKSLDFKK